MAPTGQALIHVTRCKCELSHCGRSYSDCMSCNNENAMSSQPLSCLPPCATLLSPSNHADVMSSNANLCRMFQEVMGTEGGTSHKHQRRDSKQQGLLPSTKPRHSRHCQQFHDQVLASSSLGFVQLYTASALCQRSIAEVRSGSFSPFYVIPVKKRGETLHTCRSPAYRLIAEPEVRSSNSPTYHVFQSQTSNSPRGTITGDSRPSVAR
jgi:hypothetical protein